MKYAAKLLTKSDLTLFASFYKLNGTAKQKGINLNGDVLADQFFPGLPAAVSDTGEQPVTLDIYGPDAAGLQRQRRKIVKSRGARNWRLNGKLIETPAADPGRYEPLAEGDVGVFAFDGATLPDSVSLVVLSAASLQDLPLLKAVRDGLRLKRGRGSMAALSLAQMEAFASASTAGHPLRLLLPDPSRVEDLVEAGSGDVQASRRLDSRTRAGTARPVSAAELEVARARAQEVGRTGEALIASYLDRKLKACQIIAFEWSSEKNAVSPYDFEVADADGPHLWDVKSTTGKFEAAFHISAAELETATEVPDYRIARVFGVDTGTGARFKLSAPIRTLAATVRKALGDLPAGVVVGSVQINPNLRAWLAEEPLPAADDDDDDD